MRLFPDHSVFEPGVVQWDNLDEIDLARPLNEQDSLVGCEDVLSVKYPNGAWLDVSYLRRLHPDARFVVAVVPPADEWRPAIERECRSFAELRQAVAELAPVARDWES